MHELHKQYFKKLNELRKKSVIQCVLDTGSNLKLKEDFIKFFFDNLNTLIEIEGAYKHLEQKNSELKNENIELRKDMSDLNSSLLKTTAQNFKFIDVLKYYANSKTDGEMALKILKEENIKIEETFMDLALCGAFENIASEIGIFIEKWHSSNSNLKLYEYLGFTNSEFALYIEDPNALESIIQSRML